jgi:tetratricopeptide (TPR) repeat protein
MRRTVWLGWLCSAVLGCAATVGGADGTRPRPLVDPGIADPAGSFERAQARGALDPETCQRHADAFDYRFSTSKDPLDRFNAGVVWDTCGEVEKAATAYREVVGVDPKFALAHNNLGTLAYRAGRIDDATQHYERAVRAQPTAIPPRHNLAHLHRQHYLDTGNVSAFDKAQRQLQAVLAVDSDNLEAYVGLARLYYDRAAAGDRSYALLSRLVITQAQRRERVGGTSSAELWNVQGLLSVLQGEPSRALKAFNEAIELEPDFVDARLNAALIELELRNFDAAEENLEAAAEFAKGRRAADTHLALGVAKRGLRDFDSAEKAYARAMQLDRADPRALYNVGVLYQDHIGPASNGDGLRENEIAADRFERFMKAAGSDPQFAAAVATAERRIRNMNEYADFLDDQYKLEADVKRLEALERKQREERRQELLQLERDAQDALEQRRSLTNTKAQ